LNRKRYLVVTGERDEPKAVEETAMEPSSGEPIIEYVRMVTSLIEGREVSLEEVKEMLKRNSRQHRLWRRRRVDYIVQQLNKGPP
jgi:hypothetical protein